MNPSAIVTPLARPEAPGPALSTLLSEGYVVIKDAITPEQVGRLRAELDDWFDRTPRCEGDFYGWNTTRLASMLTKAPTTRELALHPLIWPLVEPVLSPHCDYIQLNLIQGVRVHPGERVQGPHNDEEMWPCEKHGIPWLVNVMWAVDDFTRENGATRLWRGSHLGGVDRYLAEEDADIAEMRAGSACVFMGSLMHGAGANRSSLPRTGIIVSYCLGWLKTYENAFLTYPPEVAREFPLELQRLIGYRIHKPNLGGWEGQDPILCLNQPDRPVPHTDALPESAQAELDAYYGASDAA
jgi:hypothetical protein